MAVLTDNRTMSAMLVPAISRRGVFVFLTGLVIRILLLMLTPFHGYDTFAYHHWTWRLVHEPLNRFYVDDGQAFPDHLPGDIWLLKILGDASQFLDPTVDFHARSYSLVIAAMVMLFDALAVLVIWRVAYHFGDSTRASFCAYAYWLAPAPIFIACVWGQTDGISAALAVTALALGISRRFSWAMIVLSLCSLVKPQFGLLAMPLLFGWWHTSGRPWRSWLRDVLATLVACLTLMAIVSAPFDISLVGGWGTWSLVERIRLANDLYPVSTLGAHNVWILAHPFAWPPDDRLVWIFGTSRQIVGMISFAIILIFSLWILLYRWRGAVTMVLASNIIMLGSFLFMTRMHERYSFPLVALGILLAAIDNRYRCYAIVINILVFANIALRFMWSANEYRSSAIAIWLHQSWLVWVLVLATIYVFGWLLYESARRVHSSTPGMYRTSTYR